MIFTWFTAKPIIIADGQRQSSPSLDALPWKCVVIFLMSEFFLIMKYFH